MWRFSEHAVKVTNTTIICIFIYDRDDDQGMMEFVENSDKALAALEKRDNAKQESNEVNHNHDHDHDEDV